jgi:hypothetical protein
VAVVAVVAILVVSVSFTIHVYRAGKDIRHERDLFQGASERAQDQLCRSLFEQARTLLASQQMGRRWQVLELVQEAEKLRSRERPIELTPEESPEHIRGQREKLPTRAELRSLAVAALLLRDARVVREWAGIPVAISPNNRWAVLAKLQPPDWNRAKFSVANLARDQEAAGGITHSARTGNGWLGRRWEKLENPRLS